ncbi:PLP-dependent aminotransferase family protein [Acetobacterium bakii]|uniref:Transcriptional regulator n=1 Tax=Acetobacterium bakii TaxID=52689 RepID=A0A0L6U0H7_9FIRM|nr:PLP-dependent aminotransferase family protein [Acetobacterium bakii]KNZ42003.1 transcriptional regulator [Acetobacterium bakii]
MITIHFKNQGQSLYEEIYEFIKNEIRSGHLKFNEKLPSKRSLAANLSVSVNTVDSAYGQLVAEGYLEAVPKKGFFVCEIDPYLHGDELHPVDIESLQVNEDEKIKIDFSPNAIDSNLFPYDIFRKIFKSTFNEYDPNLLKRPDIQGDLGLRKALVKLLYHSRGVTCSEDQIVIGAGTDNLLQILGLIWGRDKRFVFENPVYLKAYTIVENMGNQVIPVDIDKKGIRIEPMEALSNIAIYVTPSHQFPLGMSMPIDRRIKLLNFSNQGEGAYIIEDDYDSEFRYNEKPLPSLQSIDKNGKVIYMGTFSKSIAPSMRISYMVLPKPLLKLYLEISDEISSPVSSLEQKMIAEFIVSGSFEKHINKMRKVYKEKRMFLMDALNQLEDKVRVTGENAGHHLLVQLKTGMSEALMCASALALGVKVYPISPYFINTVPKKYTSMVLLGYGSLSNDEIDEGIALLKKAWGL